MANNKKTIYTQKSIKSKLQKKNQNKESKKTHVGSELNLEPKPLFEL